jgi:hypothetical protein
MALTPEELRELERLELMELEALEVSSMEQEPEPVSEPEPERYLYNESGTVSGINPEAAPTKREAQNYISGLGQEVLGGQLSGFADELSGAVRGGLDQAMTTQVEREAAALEDAPVQQGSYAEYRDDARNTRDQFREENPGSAFAGALVGSLANPLNRVAPGMGSTGSIGTRLGQSVARGSAEGALYGFGEGEGSIEDRLANSTEGAAWGGGLSGALTAGGGAVGRVLSNKRVQEALYDAQGNFKPLHLIDKEGLLGDFYRNTVGRAWGGHQSLRAQEKPFVEASEEIIDAAENRIKRVTRDTDDVIAGAKARAITEKADIAADTRSKKTVLTQARNAAVKDTEQAVADDVQNVRATMYQESLPDDHRAVLADVDLNDPIATNIALKQFWDEDAFRMVKDRNFEWDDQLRSRVEDAFAKDPGLVLDMADEPEMISKMAAKLGLTLGESSESNAIKVYDALTAPTTEISGDALMEMRNFFAKRANRITDPGVARGNRAIRDRFDEVIESQLKKADPTAADAYREQLSRYSKYRTVRDAGKASKGAPFSLNQALTAASKRGDVQTGQVPFFDEITDAQKREVQATERAGLAKTREAQRSGRLSQRERAGKNRADREAAKVIEYQDKRGTLDLAKEAQDAARAARTTLNKARVPEQVSGLSALLTTGLLGAPIASTLGVGAGMAATVPIGTAVAKTLARPTTQRALAGQLGWQEALAKAIREGDTALATRILSRYGGQQATGE